MGLLKRISPEEVDTTSISAIDQDAFEAAEQIVGDVRTRGEDAVRGYAVQFGERTLSDPIVLGRDEMASALDELDPVDRAALERAAGRIERFAQAQRRAIQPVTIETPGGHAGHTIEPVRSAGCYAPAGRYPLPSSVLMTAITARVAGCERVVVATPGADPITLAACGIAGADEVLAVGGAHAIGAMAYGFEGFERVDVIAGPGNAYVTAAKSIVSSIVGIDMLAGPSELLIIADDSADPRLVAADLLAQAEHDDRARSMLVATDESLLDRVEGELAAQIKTLRTRDTARAGLRNGFATVCASIEEAVELSDRIAPEHLEIMTRNAQGVAEQVRHAGGVFIGSPSAEVLGDYGAGPNHTLPTGGTARFCAGLSVVHFLRLRTWIRIDDEEASRGLLADTARIASLERLHAHERAARARSG